jgi:FkbM family methyltransferase
VVAAEPQPDLMGVLRLFYGRDPDVELIPAAVGREPGTAPLLVDQATLTVTTLSKDWASRMEADPSFRGVSWQAAGEVPVTTLDALIARYGEPAFAKIDVEGYESEVLGGLSVPLGALSFEYLPAAADLALSCVDQLADLGDYRFNWSPGESHRLASARWLDTAGIRRFLAGLGPADGSGDIYARLAGDGDGRCTRIQRAQQDAVELVHGSDGGAPRGQSAHESPRPQALQDLGAAGDHVHRDIP